MSQPNYQVRSVSTAPQMQGRWDDPAWRTIEPLQIQHFHSASSDHHPRTQVKVAYDSSNLYVLFDVDDRYVFSENTEPQSSVSNDSCVEFFVQVRPGTGYFNFETNAGGTLLLHYNRVPRVDFELLPPAALKTVRVFHSMPRTIAPELPGPVKWQIELAVPTSVFEPYIGPVVLPGATMRANFYKCAGNSSHPHWGSWSPISERLDFHVPSHFGELTFVPRSSV